ncbi:MAG TPA: hypothetical protein VFQ35_02840 [Polyangiaceae bacterium]|nr:hypothetical protein [Polyangiaceae bacterium]
MDRDPEELLRELGTLHAARADELARAQPDDASPSLWGPLSEAESRAVIAAALGRLNAESCVVPVGPKSASRARRHGRELVVLAFAAVAAGVLLLLSTPRALPRYEISSPNSDSVARDVSNVTEPRRAARAGDPKHYELGRELRFVLRPAHAVKGPVRVSLFSTRGAIRSLPLAQIEQLPGGSVAGTLLTGPSGYAPVPGPDTLVFAIGVETPRSADVERGVSTSSLQLFRLNVVWHAANGEGKTDGAGERR